MSTGVRPSSRERRVTRAKGREAPAQWAFTDGGSNRPTITDRVVGSVLGLLRSGRYGVGDRLPSEWELVDQLGVGRSAIREAMRELAALNLIEIRQGSGTFVLSLRPDLVLREGQDLRARADRVLVYEYLELRQILEPEAAALAAVRATPIEIDRLEQDVEHLREGVQGGYRAPEDLGFHLDVLRATHNSALARIASSLVAFYQHDLHLPTERDIEEHSRIAHTIKVHDAAGAREVMLQHLLAERRVHDEMAGL